MNSKKSYWMLADTELPISTDPAMQETFETHYKHALLFNSKLMISDAQAVNCSNMRRLIQKNSGFEKLVSKDFLSIATRALDNNPQSEHLVEVRDAFLLEGKQNMPKNEFENNNDLNYMNDVSEIIPYRYSSLRDNYTSSIFEIFGSKKAEQIFGNDIQKLLLEKLRIENERDNGLGRVFLQKNFEGVLEKDIWSKFKNDILKLSDASYVTGLPTVLDANPIYSPLHQESFQLVYGEPTEIKEIGSSVKLTKQLNFSSYQHALSQLNVDDFYFLRQTDEFIEYQKLVGQGIANEREQAELIKSLSNYQTRINKYIIDKRLGITQQDRRYTKIIKPLLKIGASAGSFAFGLAVANPIAGAILAVAMFMHAESNERKVKSQDINRALELSNYGEELFSTPQVKIDAVISCTSQKNETIYTSINA